MFFLFTLLLILINISQEDIEYTDFPPNEEFNVENIDTKNYIMMYSGNILSYFKIKLISDENIKDIQEKLKIFEFDFIYSNFSDKVNNSTDFIISRCNDTNKEEIACIEEFSVAYGEHIYIRFIYLPFILVFTGVFLCLYGRVHYIFAIFFEFVGCFYFFIVDFVELLFSFDNSVIPFYILSAGILTGFLVAIIGKISIKNIKFLTSIKIIKAGMIGYCLIKSLFYYIGIFTHINNVLYFVFLLLFIILSGVGEFLLSFAFKTDQIIFILSSVLSGSLFITKGISFTIGGYYSDSIASVNDIKFGNDAKLRIIFFLVLHIILIIGALIFQIIDFKQREYEEALSRQSTSKSSFYSSNHTKSGNNSNNISMNKDINTNCVDNENMKTMSPKEQSPPELTNSKSGDVILNEANECEGINDQDD